MRHSVTRRQGELPELAEISNPDVVFWDGGPRAPPPTNHGPIPMLIGIWRRRGLSTPTCYPITLDPEPDRRRSQQNVMGAEVRSCSTCIQKGVAIQTIHK